jgi:hypothetical protein
MNKGQDKTHRQTHVCVLMLTLFGVNILNDPTHS